MGESEVANLDENLSGSTVEVQDLMTFDDCDVSSDLISVNLFEKKSDSCVNVVPIPNKEENDSAEERDLISFDSDGGDPVSIKINSVEVDSNSDEEDLNSGRVENLASISDSLIIYPNGDNRPHIYVDIFGKRKVLGLMDSGASKTILGNGASKLIKKLKISPRSCNTVVSVANGDAHLTTKIVDLLFTFNGKSAMISTLVVPEITAPLTLGMDFWEAFGFRPVSVNTLAFTEAPDLSNKDDNSIDLSVKERKQLDDAINNFLITEENVFGCTSILSHNINTGDSRPVRVPSYPIPYHLMPAVDEEIQRLLKLDVIKEVSFSPWNSPPNIQKKKNGKVRFCIDARGLNKVTVRDAYTIPNLESIINRLEHSQYLSSIDLSDAFLQIPLDEESQIKTSFSIPGRKMYCYKRMPFGLVNSPMTMARLMDIVIGSDLEPYVFCFLDDIIILTKDFESHIRILNEVATRLSKAGLSINLEKSKFCVRELEYLGYTLSYYGLSTNGEKIKAIANIPVPKTVKDLRQFLGMAGWFRRFVRNYATVTGPLTDLLKGNPRHLQWNQKAQESFEKLKSLLTSAPILKLPDYTKPFIVRSDASDIGAGGVLVQGEGEEEGVICYISRKFSVAEQKYSTTEKEALAALICLRRFALFLLYSKFKLETDHASLKWILSQKQAKGRIGRWIMEFQQYDFDIIHRPGKDNVVADYLSRHVCSTVGISTDKWYAQLLEDVKKDPDKYSEYKIDDGRLFRYMKYKTPLGTYAFRWRCCLPSSERKGIMQKYHDEPTAAHLGFFKTFRRISENFYWPKIRADVCKYVKNCDICKQIKSPNYDLTPPMGNFVTATRAWQHISADFIGPLVPSSEGYKFLLVLVDKLTKYVLLFPLRNSTAKSLIRVLKKNVFPYFGVPKYFHSDNGSAFIAEEFQRFLSGFGIIQWLTPGYTPQANPTERVNRTILTSIRAYIGSKHSKWPEYLSEIGMAIRSSVHETSQFSPYYLAFGQEMITHGDEYAVVDVNTPPDFADKMKTLMDSRKKAVESQKKAHTVSKKRYDLRKRPAAFAVGDVVYRRSFAQSNAAKKIQAKFCPWVKSKVVAVKGQTYQLEDLASGRKAFFHKKDIKPG